MRFMDDSPAERCGGVFVCHYLLSIVSEYPTPFTVYFIAKCVGVILLYFQHSNFFPVLSQIFKVL